MTRHGAGAGHREGPEGVGGGGLLIGLQIVGRPFHEATVSRTGQAYEAAVGGFPVPTLCSAGSDAGGTG
jgi:Asp-tRNA(Asn)/Glu-tRNA(Gln) amidotransferase A subunit family amidase